MFLLIKKALWLVVIASLTACVTRVTNFVLPEQVQFEGKTYQKVTYNQIEQMQQSLYLPTDSDKNPESWQKGILFFLDQTIPQKSLSERLRLREHAYNKQSETLANLAITQGELQTQVIYPPTERFSDVLLEVSRGRNLSCGFGQIQFSSKRSVSVNKVPKLTAYQAELAKLTQQFSKLPWLIECK